MIFSHGIFPILHLTVQKLIGQLQSFRLESFPFFFVIFAFRGCVFDQSAQLFHFGLFPGKVLFTDLLKILLLGS